MGQRARSQDSVQHTTRRTAAVRWALWTLLIAVVIWPWADTMDHTHWEKVGWIPFVSPPIRASDMIANVFLYVPFGYLGAQAIGVTGWRSVILILGAAALSTCTEAIQLYSHWRFPSATDVVCNVAGCWAGANFRKTFPRSLSGISQELSS